MGGGQSSILIIILIISKIFFFFDKKSIQRYIYIYIALWFILSGEALD